MEVLAKMQTELLKVPLGFIRLIELPMVILAFATTAGYHGCFTLLEMCPKTNPEFTVCWKYPFELVDTEVLRPTCTGTADRVVVDIGNQNLVSQSQFFVFTGVITFLYLLAILGVYLLQFDQYDKDPRYAMTDFFATAILGIFWFAGSCAWAGGVSHLKASTTYDNIKKLFEFKTTEMQHGDYAGVNVSLICGFAVTALLFANLWFIYKETHWWKSQNEARNAAGAGMGGAGGFQSGQGQTQWSGISGDFGGPPPASNAGGGDMYGGYNAERTVT